MDNFYILGMLLKWTLATNQKQIWEPHSFVSPFQITKQLCIIWNFLKQPPVDIFLID